MSNNHVTSPALAQALPHLPTSPGVYLFKDARGEVLYVGKAVNLKNRVGSYLRDQTGPRTALLVQRLAQVDFLVTATEREALILERNLIKEHHPRYNIDLRDDKNFLCLRLNLKDPAPRLALVRRFAPDGARYFGPYTSSATVRELLKFMKRVFRLRSCRDRGVPKRARPCLNYQLGQCLAPCCGLVSLAEYQQAAQEALLFLQGKGKQLRRELAGKMHQAAADSAVRRGGRAPGPAGPAGSHPGPAGDPYPEFPGSRRPGTGPGGRRGHDRRPAGAGRPGHRQPAIFLHQRR